MMGVVLWSDPEDRKAVFWCEDHGDLAYYDGSQSEPAEGRALQAGDMVEFSLEFENRIRRAYNARVIRQKGCHGLQDQLRNSAKPKSGEKAPTPQSGNRDNVIQFLKPRAQHGMMRRVQNG